MFVINQEIIKNNFIFHQLNSDEINDLLPLLEKRTLQKGDFLVVEGESSQEIFILLEGSVEVLKKEEETTFNHTLGYLKEGSTIGEMSFFDQNPRSASIKADTPITVLSLDFDQLEKLSFNNITLYKKIINNLAAELSKRLRNTNEVAVASLRKELDQRITQIQMGNFLIYIITLLCLYTFSLSLTRYFMARSSHDIVVSVSIAVFFGLFTLIVVKKIIFL